MTTTIENPPIPHVVLEVELAVPVKLPRQVVEEILGKTELDEVKPSRWLEFIEGDPDRLHDALDAYLESMPDLRAEYVEDVTESLPEPFRTIRPSDLGPLLVPDPDNEGETLTVPAPDTYEGPAPSFLERVKFTPDGIEMAKESPANVLTDEQARGALWAMRQVWNLPGMNRRQKGALVRFLSELEWVCCSRPSLHFFKASDAHATICSYCGQAEPGHDQKKEKNRDEQAQAE